MPAGEAAGNAIDAPQISGPAMQRPRAVPTLGLWLLKHCPKLYSSGLLFLAEEAPTMQRDIVAERRTSKCPLAGALPKYRPDSALP